MGFYIKKFAVGLCCLLTGITSISQASPFINIEEEIIATFKKDGILQVTLGKRAKESDFESDFSVWQFAIPFSVFNRMKSDHHLVRFELNAVTSPKQEDRTIPKTILGKLGITGRRIWNPHWIVGLYSFIDIPFHSAGWRNLSSLGNLGIEVFRPYAVTSGVVDMTFTFKQFHAWSVKVGCIRPTWECCTALSQQKLNDQWLALRITIPAFRFEWENIVKFFPPWGLSKYLSIQGGITYDFEPPYLHTKNLGGFLAVTVKPLASKTNLSRSYLSMTIDRSMTPAFHPLWVKEIPSSSQGGHSRDGSPAGHYASFERPPPSEITLSEDDTSHQTIQGLVDMQRNDPKSFEEIIQGETIPSGRMTKFAWNVLQNSQPAAFQRIKAKFTAQQTPKEPKKKSTTPNTKSGTFPINRSSINREELKILDPKPISEDTPKTPTELSSSHPSPPSTPTQPHLPTLQLPPSDSGPSVTQKKKNTNHLLTQPSTTSIRTYYTAYSDTEGSGNNSSGDDTVIN